MLNIGENARQLLMAFALLTLCTVVVRAAQASEAGDVARVIEQAVHSQQHARSLGHAWTITATYIDQAKSELASGQTDMAMVTAKRALLIAGKSVEQAKTEITSWRARVPTL